MMEEERSSISVRTAFLASTDFIWEVAQCYRTDFEVLLRMARVEEGRVEAACGWSIWCDSVVALSRGLSPRENTEAWQTLTAGSHHGFKRAYDFACNRQISWRDGFLAQEAFIEIFRSTAGDDFMTLIGDTDILEDGGPVDAAAWSDWLRAVELILPSTDEGVV